MNWKKKSGKIKQREWKRKYYIVIRHLSITNQTKYENNKKYTKKKNKIYNEKWKLKRAERYKWNVKIYEIILKINDEFFNKWWMIAKLQIALRWNINFNLMFLNNCNKNLLVQSR